MSVVAISVSISELGTICDTVDNFGEDDEDSSCWAATTTTTREDSEDDDSTFYYMIMRMSKEIIKIA